MTWSEITWPIMTRLMTCTMVRVSVRVIMDRDGVKRLEKADTWIAQKPLSHMTRVATKLAVGTAPKVGLHC
jgi:hypothetical protein